MAIAAKLGAHLSAAQIPYQIVDHRPTPSASRAAEAAHVPGDRVAKAVLLGDQKGWLLAVVPSTHEVDVGILREALGRSLELATEAQIGELFADCEVGAVPAIGAAYGVETMIDESLVEQPVVFVEAGDHRRLIKLSGADFAKLTAASQTAKFSHHV